MQGETPRTRVVNRAEADIAASYHAMLQANLDLATRSHDILRHRQQEQGLVFRERMLCNVLRPRFLTASRLADLQHISHTLADLFERAGTFLLRSDRLLDLVWADEIEREIWAVDPGYSGHTTTSRLDSFMVGGTPMFVEYNAESPASIGYCDLLSDIFATLPSMLAWEEMPSIEPFTARSHLLHSLLRAFDEWGGTAPSIAIIDWQDVATRRDFELCMEHFQANGIPTLIADPRAFEYANGTLTHAGVPITLVYRRVLLHELLGRRHEAHALLDAYRDGAVCMVNNPRSKLIHKKTLFALLSDETLGLPMSQTEREVVQATIPWTRRLIEGPTTYNGETVDLLGLLFRRQEQFALKPADDYGGRGVLLGWDTSPDHWERAVEGAIGQSFVVQERVPVPEGDFPVLKDGEIDLVSLMVDTDPLLFHGRIGGVLTRISGSALLNVTAGSGSTTPTFVVKEGAK
jgi:hypothetical protein